MVGRKEKKVDDGEGGDKAEGEQGGNGADDVQMLRLPSTNRARLTINDRSGGGMREGKSKETKQIHKAKNERSKQGE